MKANELTIGSLIKTNKGEIIKVESISTKRQHRKVGYHKDGDCYHIKYVRLAQCEGIPLTNELMESIGFIVYGNVLFLKGTQLTILHDTEDYALYTSAYSITIKYLHQLQRVLRLCGLDNVADNINIE